LKAQRWTSYHWRQWDRLTPRQRRDYEKKVEDQDNALVMGHIRGRRPLDMTRRGARYGG
jgi:hypothetical protein